jgi:hypothetical protein
MKIQLLEFVELYDFKTHVKSTAVLQNSLCAAARAIKSAIEHCYQHRDPKSVQPESSK